MSRAIGQAVAAAGAFALDHFVQWWMSCIFGWTARSGQTSRHRPQAMHKLSTILTFMMHLLRTAQGAAWFRCLGAEEKIEDFFDRFLVVGR